MKLTIAKYLCTIGQQYQKRGPFMAKPTKRSKRSKIIIAGIVCAAILIGVTIGFAAYYASQIMRPHKILLCLNW